MRHSPHTISLLQPLVDNPFLLASIKAGALRYAETKYTHRISAMPFQSGDGIARHADFNRTLSDHIARNKKRAGIEFIVSHKGDIKVIGDVVILDPFKGQVRFDAHLKGKRYTFLHVTGTVNEENLTLEVGGMGVARKEYCTNQSSRVVRAPEPHLFEPDPDSFSLILDDGQPTRVMIVTQVVGPTKETLRVWMCLPTSDFNPKEGTISLAEAQHLFDLPISGTRPQVNISTKPQSDDLGIAVTRKARGASK